MTVVLLVLASAVMPLAKVTVQRAREAELRRALREMRTAIDRFKDAADLQQIAATDLKAGAEGYPPTLEVARRGRPRQRRRQRPQAEVPAPHPDRSDDARQEWGMRSYQDDADSTSWGGQNVYDVYTKSGGVALDGTKYVDW